MFKLWSVLIWWWILNSVRESCPQWIWLLLNSKWILLAELASSPSPRTICFALPRKRGHRPQQPSNPALSKRLRGRMGQSEGRIALGICESRAPYPPFHCLPSSVSPKERTLSTTGGQSQCVWLRTAKILSKKQPSCFSRKPKERV